MAVGDSSSHEEAESKSRRFSLGSATFVSTFSEDTNMCFQTNRSPNPFEHASFLSKLFFIWPRHLMERKKDECVTEADLPGILEEDSSAFNFRQFQNIWQNEKQRADEVMRQYHQDAKTVRGVPSPPKKAYPSLSRAIVKHFFFTLWFVQPCMLFSSVGKLVQAISLGCLLQSIESRDGNGLMWAGILSLSGFVSIICLHHVFFWTWRKGMQYRISAVAAIHEKALRLKNDSSSAGKIVNLASNDCERFLLASAYGSFIIWAPLLTIAILVLGCIGIGWPFVAGFGMLVFVFIPMQFFFAKKFSFLRAKIGSITDARVTLTSQATAGVRVMKMQGWEDNFEERISSVRAKETKQIGLVNWYRARNEALFFVGNIISAAVTFVAHVGSGGVLTPRNVFTILVLLNLAQIELTKVRVGLSRAFVSQSILTTPFHLHRQLLALAVMVRASSLSHVLHCFYILCLITFASLHKRRE